MVKQFFIVVVNKPIDGYDSYSCVSPLCKTFNDAFRFLLREYCSTKKYHFDVDFIDDEISDERFFISDGSDINVEGKIIAINTDNNGNIGDNVRQAYVIFESKRIGEEKKFEATVITPNDWGRDSVYQMIDEIAARFKTQCNKHGISTDEIYESNEDNMIENWSKELGYDDIAQNFIWFEIHDII